MSDTDHLDSDAARLELNARGFKYDATLEAAADLYDTDVAAWQQLPVELQDRSGMYRDFREYHRQAVAAGVIPEGDHR